MQRHQLGIDMMLRLAAIAILLCAPLMARADGPPSVPAELLARPVSPAAPGLDLDGTLLKTPLGVSVKPGHRDDAEGYYFQWRDAAPHCVLTDVKTGQVVAELPAAGRALGFRCPEIVHE